MIEPSRFSVFSVFYAPPKTCCHTKTAARDHHTQQEEKKQALFLVCLRHSPLHWYRRGLFGNTAFSQILQPSFSHSFACLLYDQELSLEATKNERLPYTGVVKDQRNATLSTHTKPNSCFSLDCCSWFSFLFCVVIFYHTKYIRGSLPIHILK
jgi:hypothetical protein